MSISSSWRQANIRAEHERFVIGRPLGGHTWDLARATGLDETLDADVPADADEQTKLIAFTGRQP